MRYTINSKKSRIFRRFKGQYLPMFFYPLDLTQWRNILENNRNNALMHEFFDPQYVPIFIKHIPRRSKKGYYIFKVGSLYYSAHERLRNSTTIYLTCTTHKSRIKTVKCTFKVSLKILNVFDELHPYYYDPSNFLVKPSLRHEPHSCEGYESFSEVCQSLRL